MENFLKKLKLVEDLTTEIEIEKREFIKILNTHVDSSNLGLFSDIGDVFLSSKNEYKGTVDFQGFKIRKRKRFFDTNMNLANAIGTFSQKGNQLIIHTKINGFRKMFIPFYIFIIIFYLIFASTFFFIGNVTSEDGMNYIILPFLLLHASFMMGIPYFLMRRSVKKMKRELEREFYYITKK